jgi:uncharacterized membrane protein
MITAPHLHAMVIHFPIALIMTAFLSEIIYIFNKKEFYRYASFYLLIFGVTGTMAAYSSGSYASDGMTDSLPLEMHEDAATITLWLAIITVVFKGLMYNFNYQKTWARWLSFLLFVVLVGYVARTGYLDGELVFKHGAGIELALPEFTK